MTNKYLTKIAKSDIAASGTGLDNVEKAPRATLKEPVKPLPTLAKEAGVVEGVKAWTKTLNGTDKVKIGMSATGLGLGTVGYVEGHKKMKGDRHRENLEAQSLTTLRKIHEALAKQQETN
jgi:hypothetical protein